MLCFERMISERGNIAATYTAEGNSEAQVIAIRQIRKRHFNIRSRERSRDIKAEGEAQYMEIMADAYKDEMRADFYSFFTRSLDAVRKCQLQGGNKTIILDKSSPITQIFY